MRHVYSPPAAPSASPVAAPALVLVAHGSRDPRHAATVASLRAELREHRPDLRVEAAYLEFDEPRVDRVLARLDGEGYREAVAVPLLLSRAFHAKTDIPHTLREATVGLPRLRVRQSGVLGPHPLLTAALHRRLQETALLGPDDAAGTGVVLAAAGSSDPEAIRAVEDVAVDWQRSAGWRAVRTAYASADLPRTADVVRALRAEGVRRVVVAPYVLAPGRLPDRIAAGAREAGADALAPVLGPAPEVTRLLLRRFDEACAAPPTLRAA